MVARLLWEQDVGGSNPFTPTTSVTLDPIRVSGFPRREIFLLASRVKRYKNIRTTSVTLDPIRVSGFPRGEIFLLASRVKCCKNIRTTSVTLDPIRVSGFPRREIFLLASRAHSAVPPFPQKGMLDSVTCLRALAYEEIIASV